MMSDWEGPSARLRLPQALSTIVCNLALVDSASFARTAAVFSQLFLFSYRGPEVSLD